MNPHGQHRLGIAIGAFLLVLLMVVGSVGFESMLGQAKSADLSAGPTISNTFETAVAWNGTTFVVLTATITGETVTLKTPAGFAAQSIMIFEKNPTWDMKGLLNTSNIYNFVQLTTSTSATGATSGHYINMTAAYQIIGHNVNGTNMKDHASKGWINVVSNRTLYNSNTNILNASNELNLFAMYRSLTAFVGYNIVLSDTAVNATTVLTVTFTQEFQHPFSLNLLSDTTVAVAITAILAAIGVFMSEGIGIVRRRQ